MISPIIPFVPSLSWSYEPDSFSTTILTRSVTLNVCTRTLEYCTGGARRLFSNFEDQQDGHCDQSFHCGSWKEGLTYSKTASEHHRCNIQVCSQLLTRCIYLILWNGIPSEPIAHQIHLIPWNRFTSQLFQMGENGHFGIPKSPGLDGFGVTYRVMTL